MEKQDPLRWQRQTFQAMAEGVIVTDPEGVILEWNPAATAIFGYAREETLGKTATFLHPREEGTDLLARILRGVERDGRWRGFCIAS